MATRKDYLSYENDRNKRRHKLYTDILTVAFGNEGILIAHHLVFGGGDSPDEIPSADTLIFDHDIMQKIFGDDFKWVLTQLACEPCESRDELLATLFYQRPGSPAVTPAVAHEGDPWEISQAA